MVGNSQRLRAEESGKLKPKGEKAPCVVDTEQQKQRPQGSESLVFQGRAGARQQLAEGKGQRDTEDF